MTMNALELGCLTSALGLVGSLVAPATACAHDTTVAEKARGTTATHAIATAEPLAPSVVSTATEIAGLAGGGELPVPVTTAPASAAPANGADAAPVRVDITKSDEAPAEASCDKDCELSSSSEIKLLPQVVMKTLVEMPVVGTFLITPVTTGVTVAPVEGLPALTFAVKPTKITQGSGLVAIGRF
jgi:hypothetical protein